MLAFGARKTSRWGTPMIRNTLAFAAAVLLFAAGTCQTALGPSRIERLQ
jgi:hypothetical protein